MRTYKILLSFVAAVLISCMLTVSALADSSILTQEFSVGGVTFRLPEGWVESRSDSSDAINFSGDGSSWLIFYDCDDSVLSGKTNSQGAGGIYTFLSSGFNYYSYAMGTIDGNWYSYLEFTYGLSVTSYGSCTTIYTTDGIYNFYYFEAATDTDRFSIADLLDTISIAKSGNTLPVSVAATATTLPQEAELADITFCLPEEWALDSTDEKDGQIKNTYKGSTGSIIITADEVTDSLMSSPYDYNLLFAMANDDTDFYNSQVGLVGNHYYQVITLRKSTSVYYDVITIFTEDTLYSFYCYYNKSTSGFTSDDFLSSVSLKSEIEAENPIGGQNEDTVAPKTENNLYTLRYGDLLDATITGATLYIEATIYPSYNDSATVRQNFYNIYDLINNQGCDEFDEIHYTAYLETEDGQTITAVTFTVAADGIEIIKGSHLPQLIGRLSNEITNLEVDPSLQWAS